MVKLEKESRSCLFQSIALPKANSEEICPPLPLCTNKNKKMITERKGNIRNPKKTFLFLPQLFRQTSKMGMKTTAATTGQAMAIQNPKAVHKLNKMRTCK